MIHLEKFVSTCHDTIFKKGNKESEEALAYLTQRHLNKETIEANKIGYCPWKCEIPAEVKEFGKKPGEDRIVDHSYRIRGRIIVPIYSEFGKLVGLATRKPTFAEGYSWWNLPFPKGNHFFLMDKARKNIFEDNIIYIVEGYMDALVLWQEGLKTVVGLMGSKLTLRKVGLIARYCNNVCLSLDTDANQSGQKGKNQSVALLHKFGFCESISEITLPLKDGQKSQDPDDFVTKNGLDKYKSMRQTIDSATIRKICEEYQKEKESETKT